MIHTPTSENQTILFGVTSSQSLKLLGSIPTAIARLGWDVHVVAGDALSRVPKHLDGITVHILPMQRKPSPLSDISSLIGWLRLIRKVRPTIVIMGTPKCSLLGIIASYLSGVPTRIYHLRGLRLETASRLAQLFLLLIEWTIAKCATHIVAVSPSLKQEYCRLRLSTESKINVLGFGSSHGVDIDHFRRTAWKDLGPTEPKLRQTMASGTLILGFVGRFSRDKGARELLKCCQVLVQSGVRYSLLVIGPVEGERETLKKLQELAQETIIMGPVTDVAPYYSIMDLLLLPTHREGFPNAVLEAAASGVPTVTTDATGAIDSVIDGQTGVIVPAHDEEAYATAVLSLVKDSQLLHELGASARARAVANFDSKTVAKQFVDFLRQIAEPSRSAYEERPTIN